MNTQNKETKGKSHRIWGWIFTILGGLFTLFGILVILLGLSSSDSGVRAWGLILGVLTFGIGIPSLITGIWLFFYKEKLENRRIWGLILAVVGVPFALWGIYCMILFISDIVSPPPGSNPLNYTLFNMNIRWGTPGLLIGVSLLIVGILFITQKGKIEIRRILGWVLAIIGGFFTLNAILYFIMSFVFSDQGEGVVVFAIMEAGRSLVIGVLLLVIGVWLILRKGKTPTANLGGSNNLQGEVKNEH